MCVANKYPSYVSIDIPGTRRRRRRRKKNLSTLFNPTPVHTRFFHPPPPPGSFYQLSKWVYHFLFPIEILLDHGSTDGMIEIAVVFKRVAGEGSVDVGEFAIPV